MFESRPETVQTVDVCVLASSSSGNSIAVRYGEEILLIDAGLSARATERRLDEIGWSSREILGIVLSHEHQDHCRGASLLGRRYGVPIYGTAGTLAALASQWRGDESLNEIENGYSFTVGPFTCEPFSIPHDVSDPAMYIVRCNGRSVGVATDLGRVTSLVRNKLASTDLALIEANHDPDRLRWGDYPWAIKQRISSPHGHLDNEQAAGLAVELADAGVSHIVLGHLSPSHNDVEQVASVIGTALAKANLRPRVTVIAPTERSGIISVTNGSSSA